VHPRTHPSDLHSHQRGPYRWNQDGNSMETGVHQDINGDGATTLLTGSNDWANLNFIFQASSNFANGEPSTKVVDGIGPVLSPSSSVSDAPLGLPPAQLSTTPTGDRSSGARLWP